MNVVNTLDAAIAAVSANPAKAATATVHDSADARVVLFRIDAGKAVPVHTSTSSVLLLVVSGSGTVTGAEGDRDVRTGDMIAYAPSEPHGMRATTERLVIAAVIAPRPGSR